MRFYFGRGSKVKTGIGERNGSKTFPFRIKKEYSRWLRWLDESFVVETGN